MFNNDGGVGPGSQANSVVANSTIESIQQQAILGLESFENQGNFQITSGQRNARLLRVNANCDVYIYISIALTIAAIWAPEVELPILAGFIALDFSDAILLISAAYAAAGTACSHRG